MNFCTRDYLQIDNQSYCDSTIDQKLDVNSSIYLTFKTNDVITRKGFWLMMNSDQSIEISCKNSLDLPFPTTSTPLTTTTTVYLTSILPLTNSSNIHSTRRYTLSFILILTIIFVIILLILNLILIILCWKQRRTKENRLDSKTGTTHQPFFCSKRYSTSSSSSITYGETPVLNSLDAQKNQQTTSTTTATTGTYEDPNECLNFQQKQKFDLNHSFYLKHRPEPKIFSPIILPSSPPPTTTMHTGYNPMIHSHFNISSQTFYPFGSQHIYETIPDGYCPYQRLASTLRRQQQQCTCYCTHNEQKHLTKIDDQENNLNIESNPETLV